MNFFLRARPSSRRRQRRRAAWLAAAVVVSVAGPWLVRGWSVASGGGSGGWRWSS